MLTRDELQKIATDVVEYGMSMGLVLPTIDIAWCRECQVFHLYAEAFKTPTCQQMIWRSDNIDCLDDGRKLLAFCTIQMDCLAAMVSTRH